MATEEKKKATFWNKLIFDEKFLEKNQQSVESAKPKFPQQQQAVKFPNNNTTTFPEPVVQTFTPVPPENNPACAPHLAKILDMYEKGFEELNQPGYDFYEYLKGVTDTGEESPLVYKMAFTMGKSQDKSITKETLLAQSEFYINELNSVHSKYASEGAQRKTDLTNQKNTESANLSAELVNIKAQIDRLLLEKSAKEQTLASIGNKFEPQITEVDCKMMANDVAKNKIVGAIDKVKQGIATYL